MWRELGRDAHAGASSCRPPRWALFTWDQATGSYYGGDEWCWKLNSPALCKKASDLLSTWQAGGCRAAADAPWLSQGLWSRCRVWVMGPTGFADNMLSEHII